jgi:DNA-binding response OmpR family regulator/serine phosphatase RsbU (regulator of sigma subunit)/anti-sigma regulatory factor (Ser/Thr protein kinase)
VLVIDDNADMREYLERLLSSDYAVMTAGDGLAGIASARTHLPDLVLSDVMMPGLDGFGVLATLRREPLTQHIPVVLLSARAGEESTVEGLEAGADDYLIKPFTARELLARVGANLELDRSRRTREHLERNQALLDQTQRLARIGSWELDLASRRVTASAEMRRQLRILTDEEIGAPSVEQALDAGVLPDHAAALRAAIARTATTGEPMDVELGVDVGDGKQWVYRVLGELVRDSGGAPLLIRGSCQDVTDQRAAERAVAAAAAAREAAAREHRIADELQRSLVPAPAFSPDNLTIATYYRPGVEGTQVGGDWYDVIELGAGRTALVLGDVMGRGVQAAAVMGQLRAAIRAYARLDLPPADVLELLDAAVRSLGEDQIVTAVYAVYDPGEGTLSYANAGHIPPILCLPGAAPCRLDGGAGPPLGVGPLTVAAGQIDLPPGSMLALYTDGLVERRGSDIDSGIDRLLALLSPPPADIGALPARMVEQLLPEGPDDDVAVLLASVVPAPLPGRTASLHLAAEERAVHEARSFVAATLDDWGLATGVTEDAVLVASELITNAVLHGKVPVELRLRATATDLVLQALDGATSLPQRMRPTADDEHGRGLQIVALLAARWGTRPTPSGKSVWCMLPIG